MTSGFPSPPRPRAGGRPRCRRRCGHATTCVTAPPQTTAARFSPTRTLHLVPTSGPSSSGSPRTTAPHVFTTGVRCARSPLAALERLRAHRYDASPKSAAQPVSPKDPKPSAPSEAAPPSLAAAKEAKSPKSSASAPATCALAAPSPAPWPVSVAGGAKGSPPSAKGSDAP